MMKPILLALMLIGSIAFAVTPNMSLDLPTPTVTTGPEWANKINTAFTTLDSHNHTSGHGAPIPTSAISMDAALSCNGYDLLNVRSSRFQNQTSPLSTVNDKSEVYVSGGNLYYNNSIGQQVQITSGAGLNAASIGAIGGDYATSTASEFYTSVSGLFTFWQAANLPASLDSGPITTRPIATSPNGITIQAPTGLSASYAMTLPTGVPVSNKFLTMNSSGTIAASYDVDNSTLGIASNVIKVNSGGITSTQIADGTIVANDLATGAVTTTKIANLNVTTATIADNNVTTGKIADLAVTQTKLAAKIIGSSDSGSFSYSSPGSWVQVATVNLVTSARPIRMAIVPYYVGQGFLNSGISVSGTGTGRIRMLINGSPVAYSELFNIPNAAQWFPVEYMQTTSGSGSGNYSWEINLSGVGTVSYVRFLAYEL